MPKYLVILPIAGHVSIEVEAENKERAINVAIDNATLKDLDDWESLPRVNSGNVCHFPTPWEAEAEEIEED